MSLAASSLLFEAQVIAPESQYREALKEIDRQVAALAPEFPQLADYAKNRRLDLHRLSIRYEFRTHLPKRSGGWTSGVPEPNDDGIWIHIDLHDPDSQAEIHTQPFVLTKVPLGRKVAFLLVLEGPQGMPSAGRIWQILKTVADRSNSANTERPDSK